MEGSLEKPSNRFGFLSGNPKTVHAQQPDAVRSSTSRVVRSELSRSICRPWGSCATWQKLESKTLPETYGHGSKAKSYPSEHPIQSATKIAQNGTIGFHSHIRIRRSESESLKKASPK